MKKFIMLSAAVLTLGFTSCGNPHTAADAEAAEDSAVVAVDQAITVEQALGQADSLVNKEITLRGDITHICKHSGRHCFMVGAQDSTLSMRIDAKGNIGGFNRELNGTEIAVRGILHEGKLSQEYIDDMEKALEAEKAEGKEVCDADMQNIIHMRDWMKANNREAFSIYYLEGLDFEVLE